MAKGIVTVHANGKRVVHTEENTVVPKKPVVEKTTEVARKPDVATSGEEPQTSKSAENHSREKSDVRPVEKAKSEEKSAK